jgi:hypothetical protein
VTERRFTDRDQRLFAELSGDHNPIHLDPLEARRTLFGRVVVHGVHAALGGLDVALSRADRDVSLTSVRAAFLSPIGVGEAVRTSHTSEGDAVDVEIEVRGTTAARIRFSWSARRDPGGVFPQEGPPERGPCWETVPEELPARAGRLPLHLDRDRAAILFPVLTRRLDPIQFAQILATTRLVGMECPGLRSVFSELQVDFSAPAAEAGEVGDLAYRVDRYYPGLSLVSIDLMSFRMSAALKAFVRPAPRVQPSIKELARSVRPDEFAGQRALIIGGSRGLGEVSAKLLAAGGASVVLTYRQGRAEAERVVRDIFDHGGESSCLPWDVLGTGEGRALPTGCSPTHLYYFATPHITPGRPGVFSADLFDTFRDYYVTGFLAGVEALLERSDDLRAVFYPSSVYVEAPPPNLAEYSAAKSAGESAARLLATQHPGWIVEAPRLPRLATDQTATLLRAPIEEPAAVLLAHLRAFHARSLAASAGPSPATEPELDRPVTPGGKS